LGHDYPKPVPVREGDERREYKAFLSWYRNEFELGYPNGLGFEFVKAAFLAGYAQCVGDEYP
jgi:hypothetical protein